MDTKPTPACDALVPLPERGLSGDLASLDVRDDAAICACGAIHYVRVGDYWVPRRADQE